MEGPLLAYRILKGLIPDIKLYGCCVFLAVAHLRVEERRMVESGKYRAGGGVRHQ